MGRVIIVGALLAALGMTPAHADAAAKRTRRGVAIRALSTRADLVSTGRLLIAVDVPPKVRRNALHVRANGRDVTGELSRRGTGPLTGIVDGLPLGRSTISARIRDGRGAALTVSSHPPGGPLFAGPQVQPWTCLTEPAGLGPALDAQCDAKGTVDHAFFFMDEGSHALAAYDPATPPAADRIATTRTDDGRTVPFVVRVQRGTLDRSVYDVATLYDPPTRQTTWNGKLFVPFGGACSAKHSQQPPAGIEVSGSAPDGAVVRDQQLARGYAVATTGLSTLAQNCNPVVSAEALQMLKERVALEQGRPIRYTIGEGCSGGSIQQHTIADAYPGLLDGLIPSCSFPDAWSVVTEVFDCVAIENALTGSALLATPARQAIEGSALGSTCSAWLATFAPLFKPDDRMGAITTCDVPADQQYDPQTNRAGVRCTVQDYAIAEWGVDPATGFARRPIDNVGIQYGLVALREGRISPQEFVDLNARIGGLDADGRPTAARTAIDPETVRIAYASDAITRMRNLARVAIIDVRGTGNAEVHTDHWSYATRARLEAANGTAANQVIWTDAVDNAGGVGKPLPGTQEPAAFATMDRWLAAVEADPTGRSRPEKVIADKPADATDACFTPERTTDSERCAQLLPHYGNPRTAAGEPQTLDVVKCALRPPVRADYPAALNDAQFAQLQTVFPSGVCDWAASRADRPEPITWPTFADGPGGRALGPSPASKPLRRRHR